MPLVNFIVEANVDDPSPQVLLDLSSDMSDALDSVVDVVSVKPWARPSVGLTPDLIQSQVPPPSQSLPLGPA